MSKTPKYIEVEGQSYVKVSFVRDVLTIAAETSDAQVRPRHWLLGDTSAPARHASGVLRGLRDLLVNWSEGSLPPILEEES